VKKKKETTQFKGKEWGRKSIPFSTGKEGRDTERRKQKKDAKWAREGYRGEKKGGSRL